MANNEHFAVIVGINYYTPENLGGLPTLEAPMNDASDFEEWLLTIGGLPKKNIEVVKSTANPLEPLQKQVDDAIIKTILKVPQTGAERIYFYFSGHGVGIDMTSTKVSAMCLADWSSIRRN